MKKIQSIISIFIVISTLFCLFSCSNDNQTNNKNKLIGEWQLESQNYSNGGSSSWKLETIKLYEDGTCSVEGEVGTWKIVDDELMVLGSYGGRFWYSDSIVGKYHCDGKTLKFFEAQIDGKNNSVDLVYKKVK